MKKLFIYIIIVLTMIGCGSNDTKYSVTDDGNGTHSPRIMRVALTEYSYDDNTTKEMTILYKYNKENLLIEKKELDKKNSFFKKVEINTIEKKTKKKSLNIRLFEDDIEKIKAIAFEQGLPYQTLISSVIHKLAQKQIKVA